MDFDEKQVTNNPKDPLTSMSNEAGKALFDQMVQMCNGFPYEAVCDAAANLIINAIRQKYPKAKEAEAVFDELSYKLKALLLGSHYDLMGNRKNIFPFTQSIEHQLFDARGLRKFPGVGWSENT
jgi:hypothetical protein